MYTDLLRQSGGVIRTSELIEAGLSRHHLAKQVSYGRLRRIKRGWVATPRADPALVFAAQHGVTLSCVTQAARLKIWVRDSSLQHYAVPRPGSELRAAQIHLHYRKPLIPRPRFALVDSLTDTLVNIAHCQPHEDAVASWDSALNKQLIDRTLLEQLPLSATARKVLQSTSPFADSGLESYVRLRLRWMRIPIRPQIWIAGHRVDFLIGERLVLQVDGGHHTGEQRDIDNAHDADLRNRGYEVIRVGYRQVMDQWPMVQEQIMLAIANRLHLARVA